MKLSELKEFIENKLNDLNDHKNDTQLYGESLELLIPLLKQCEEFENVEEIIIMNSPIQMFKNDCGESYTVSSKTYTYHPNMKIKSKKIYLWSIFLTRMYAPFSDINKNIITTQNFITPVMYNIDDFSPIQKIVLNIPESINTNKDNIDVITDEQKIFMLQQLLNVFNNPEKYTLKGEKKILIRGDFELEDTKELNK